MVSHRLHKTRIFYLWFVENRHFLIHQLLPIKSLEESVVFNVVNTVVQISVSLTQIVITKFLDKRFGSIVEIFWEPQFLV